MLRMGCWVVGLRFKDIIGMVVAKGGDRAGQ